MSSGSFGVIHMTEVQRDELCTVFLYNTIYNTHKFSLLNRHVFLWKVTQSWNENNEHVLCYCETRSKDSACVMSWNQNSSTVLIHRISAYFDFCWFSILLTNLHQLENSMEQVFVSPKWGPEAPVIEPVRTDWRRMTTGGCCCAVGFFSRLNRKHYPDMKWIWLFKERWPLNSIYIFEWYWNVMAAALFPKMFGP